ncbi:MAG: aldolase/citrate lyase family protein [Bacteroidales bacterium]|nr:aldolase/citrate lyase family protein [Bacteroidales bacterium]MDD4213939.1 aldolase/citrate lyase family protein [Bacteroidales bacterium]
MKQNKIVSAGNKGKSVRSDCYITLELSEKGGITIDLTSKVKALYEKTIIKQLKDILVFFDIKNARVTIEDSGALPFVISARMEAAIKQLLKTEKEYLPDLLLSNQYKTLKDRNRISRLYLPGNTPSLMINAGIHKPDGIILDLEDAVSPDKKFEATFIVRNALRNLDFYGAERMVRINQVPCGLDDLNYVVPHYVNLILIPKCENALQIHAVNERISNLKKKHKLDYDIWLMPIIESAKGVLKSYEIACSAENVVAMAIGLEDYTADIGVKRSAEAEESLWARSMVVNACHATGIQAIDSVFSDVSDMEGLKQNVLKSKALGFDGMGCIHPRQIRVIHENFAPDSTEIAKAKKIVNAFLEAREKGLGVVSLGTKMIDAPVVKRAQKTINLAISTGKISKNWREEENEKI